MFNFFDGLAKYGTFLTNSEGEAARTSSQGGSSGQGRPGERPEDPETAQGSGAAVEDTSGGVGLGEPTGNSSSAETGLGNLPGTTTKETKGP